MADSRLFGFWGGLTEGLRTGGLQNEARSGGLPFFEAIIDDDRRENAFGAS